LSRDEKTRDEKSPNPVEHGRVVWTIAYISYFLYLLLLNCNWYKTNKPDSARFYCYFLRWYR